MLKFSRKYVFIKIKLNCFKPKTVSATSSFPLPPPPHVAALKRGTLFTKDTVKLSKAGVYQ